MSNEGNKYFPSCEYCNNQSNIILIVESEIESVLEAKLDVILPVDERAQEGADYRTWVM